MSNPDFADHKLSDPDLQAIYQAAADYYGGWYAANVEQIGRSLHPGLAKRAIRKDKQGNEYLHNLNKEQMLEKTEEGGGSDTSKDLPYSTSAWIPSSSIP